MTQLTMLFYDYVPDVLERRGPYRERHIELLRDGGGIMAGVLGEPPHGAALLFTTIEEAEAFAAADPYVEHGLVTGSRIEPWTLGFRR